eukprot:TRINITY_DN23219_c0_g1_i1.p1 TRINITY_DN23219_c0_g1~~TRINITY_DN23219_c0_g1_i1.p1  ORF type:complete len:1428 (-),score=165.40 TRINITY_DN23219_c0_g1_i1:57-4340(-)
MRHASGESESSADATKSGGEAVAPHSRWQMFLVVVKKHMLVSWKRYRVLTTVGTTLLYTIVSCLICHLCTHHSANALLEDMLDESTLHMLRLMLFALFVPFFVVSAINAVFTSVVVEIVSEKETKMKVIQEIYGCTDFTYWMSWVAYFFIVSSICVGMIVFGLTVVVPVFVNSNLVLIVWLLMGGYIQSYSVGAVFSVFFNNKQTAAVVTNFVNVGIQMLGMLMDASFDGSSAGLMRFLPMVNVQQGISAALWLEAMYFWDGTAWIKGLQLGTLWAEQLCYMDPGSKECPKGRTIAVPGQCLCMNVVNTVFYTFLAWWLGNVWQGEYGSAKPLFFFLKRAYMCPRRSSEGESAAACNDEQRSPLKMEQLRKVFKSGQVAVDDMTMEVQRGEIFALLGHNGAGKTTCINCIVGLIPPTSGTARVCGIDVSTDCDAARRQMSICPQDNPLYDVFTVRQHLHFFANLRGVPRARIEERVNAVLYHLEMSEKADALCTCLSGGQKRRLWVATALVGERSLVFLDEPTSGMDPSSRRRFWNLLLKLRGRGNSVVFTTHYLDEADALADRKAVLAKGKVQALGTSMELKAQFGLGYRLRVAMRHDANVVDAEKALTGLVQRHVRTSKILDPEGRGVADSKAAFEFMLPYDGVPHFGPLLLELEEKQQALGVVNCNVTTTTLEEVFMRLGQVAEKSGSPTAAAGADSSVESSLGEAEFPEPEPDVLTPKALLERAHCSTIDHWRNGRAVAVVRFRQARGNPKALYTTAVLPVFFILLSFFLDKNVGSSNPLPGFSASALYPAMAFAVATPVYAAQLLDDREHKCKFVCRAQGLSPRSYWIGTVVGHYVLMLPVCIVYVVTLMYLEPSEIPKASWPLLLIELFCFPLQVLVYTYASCYLFLGGVSTNGELVTKILTLCSTLLAFIPPVIIAGLSTVGGEWAQLSDKLHLALSILDPLYALPATISKIQVQKGKDKFSMDGFDEFAALAALLGSFAEEVLNADASPSDFFWKDGRISQCAVPLCAFPVSLFFWCVLLARLEKRAERSTSSAAYDSADDQKDEDVLAEEKRVSESVAANASGAQEAAACQNLKHVYRTKVNGKWQEVPAVRGVSLGVRPGECFGLLGPNGAGKTTTLALLTGELLSPSAGSVHILAHNMNVESEREAAFRRLGVCPQIDPLWKHLSGREHLQFYGRIKGVPDQDLNVTVSNLMTRLGFQPADVDKKVGQYSGGMKRKLSVAIALIGHSPLLFLDEPSAALDAAAKRHLWKVIRNRGPDQAVLVTTHSMEEAEALCERIAFQLKGQLRSLGTPAHIKQKYGTGYRLELVCRRMSTSRPAAIEGDDAHNLESSSDAIIKFVTTRLSPQAKLLEHHGKRYVYQLPPLDGSFTLGRIFQELSENKETVGIEDYSLTQPSLEQVFVRFAHEQEQSEEKATGS